MTEACRTEYFLWLSTVCYPGSSLPKRLYLAFDGDMKRVYETPGDRFSSIGCGAEECRRLDGKDFSAANRILDYCAENRVTIITYDSPLYPERLFSIDNPPPVLYAKGAIHRLREGPSVAAVGSRGCSEKGYRDMYTLCYRLAGSGVAIVTGLADGIDHAAALAALDSGGLSIGVLGSGINILYPFESTDLFERMLKSGIMLTEFSPFTEPLARNFPIRNRVISALCDVCLVGEARSGSGALITAKHAFLSGKKVFAVPGALYDRRYEGTNFLLRNGALPVTRAEDISDGLAFSYPEVRSLKRRSPLPRVPAMPAQKEKKRGRKKAAPQSDGDLPFDGVTESVLFSAERKSRPVVPQSNRSDEENRILSFLANGEKTADMLAADCGTDTATVLTALTMLEIDGAVESLPGGAYRLAAAVPSDESDA